MSDSNDNNSPNSMNIMELMEKIAFEQHEITMELYRRWEEQQQCTEHGESSSSRPTGKKRRTINRDRVGGAMRLFNDYFSENPTFPLEVFRRRFRMRRPLFLRIVDAIKNHDNYFQHGHDAMGNPSLSTLQKCTIAMRLLAYGTAADAVDEYLRAGETTAIECLQRFVKGVIAVFGVEYLRRPNEADVERLLRIGESRGFPGMMGSIDCMHWTWRNCPKAWHGQHRSGYHREPSLILEAVAGPDLWIWHAYFGVAGANNDLNVLARSPVFDDVLNGIAPKVNFTVNNHNYDMGYYLTDGIYPQWATFVKTIPRPKDEKGKLFAQYQEGARKDVERAFGVLQSRFAIVRGPARGWSKENLGEIMRACIILHNMIVEDERDGYGVNFDSMADAHLSYDQIPGGIPTPRIGGSNFTPYQQYIRTHMKIRDRGTHRQLQDDLVEHIWQFHHYRHEM